MELGNHHERTIAHFDLDAFYVACERELNTALVNKPVAVSQYNPYGNLRETRSNEIEKRLVARPPVVGETARIIGGDKNGSMIAVSYEARSKGIKRGIRGLDAVQKCPDLFIVQVPVKRGKADLSMYRNASHRVIETLITSLLGQISVVDRDEDTEKTRGEDWIGRHILNLIKRIDIKVEKASIDEIYIDLSVPVNKMTELILALQSAENSKRQGQPCSEYKERDIAIHLWDDIIYYGRDQGCTTIGGIESLSNSARAANQLSKDEVRKGSQLQVIEQYLDSGSRTWWSRPLLQWTEIEIRLACGSALAKRARQAAQEKFEIDLPGHAKRTPIFTLSGGISSNKTLAKLASGLKKPNRQTMVNPSDFDALTALFHPLKINRIRGLGGKFGESIQETLGLSTVGDLAKIPLTVLKSKYPPSIEDERPIADFLYTIAKGVCMEEVSERTVEKSMSSGKTFRGALGLKISDEAAIRKWISELVGGLLDRLTTDYEENMRLPSLLVLSMKLNGERLHALSKSMRAPHNLAHAAYVDAVMRIYRQFSKKKHGKVHGITVTASSFHQVASGQSSITGAFLRGTQLSSQQTPSSQMLSSPKRSPLIGAWSKSCVYSSGTGRETMLREKNVDGVNDKEGSVINLSTDRCTETTKAPVLVNGIDKSILSQLPVSIQSEIRIDSMSKIGKVNKRKRGTNSSAYNMKKWLTNSTSKSNSSSKKNEKVEVRQSPNQQSLGDAYIHDAVIDTKILAELPFHIQVQIRKEMRASKQRK